MQLLSCQRLSNRRRLLRFKSRAKQTAIDRCLFHSEVLEKQSLPSRSREYFVGESDLRQEICTVDSHGCDSREVKKNYFGCFWKTN